MNTNIFLVGMPSSGKSTLGRTLAKAISYQFVDMDDLIEKQEGSTVPQIFRALGEDYFRTIESNILKEIPTDKQLVIATGGGVPCFFDNMYYIKTHGKSVFLDVKPAVLLQRITQSKTNHRPLIDKSDPQALLLNLQTRYEQRLPFYSQADFIVEPPISMPELIAMLFR